MDDKVLVDIDPPVPREPLQPPEAVQLEALLEAQVSVALPPTGIAVGVATSETVGGEVTVIVALAVVEPPEPLQLSM